MQLFIDKYAVVAKNKIKNNKKEEHQTHKLLLGLEQLLDNV